MEKLADILLMAPGILLGFTVHELAHAVSAWKLGDPTAKNDGRITLNPIKHIDPIGFIMIVMFGFGWAKPVLVNPGNLKHPIRDGAIIAIAGPAANFLIALLLFPVFWGAQAAYPSLDAPWFGWILAGIYYAISVNLMLFLFNLIPLPPLDGSRILVSAIPPRYYNALTVFMRVGPWILLGIILLENVTKIDLLPISSFTKTLFSMINSLNPF